MMIGETGPTGALKVATSLLTLVSNPGAAPPDQFKPVLHSPSLPPPVQVWLAARAPCGSASAQANTTEVRIDCIAPHRPGADDDGETATETGLTQVIGCPPTETAERLKMVSPPIAGERHPVPRTSSYGGKTQL